jgi:hypothetical protein
VTLDPRIKRDIEQPWKVVRFLCRGSHRQAQLPGGPFINETPLDEHYNLPFVLAFAVLDQVLDELIAQGLFKPRGTLLGAKMDASRGALPWQGYDLVWDGKEKRNDLAHEAKLLKKADCLRYVDAIEAELRAWNVI